MPKRKVWLALGTAALVVAQAGDGGERRHGNGGPAAEDSDLPRNLRLLRELRVIRGHLLVVDEPIREGEVDRAEMCSNARVRRRKPRQLGFECYANAVALPPSDRATLLP
jgi:hypothetical protein